VESKLVVEGIKLAMKSSSARIFKELLEPITADFLFILTTIVNCPISLSSTYYFPTKLIPSFKQTGLFKTKHSAGMIEITLVVFLILISVTSIHSSTNEACRNAQSSGCADMVWPAYGRPEQTTTTTANAELLLQLIIC